MDMDVDRKLGARDWMVSYLADLLDIDPTEVDVTRPLDQLGLDSAASVAFISDLSRWLGMQLDARVIVEADTIEALTAFIQAGDVTGGAGRP